jgi:hypothetical protein
VVVKKSAHAPPVIHFLVPLTTKTSPSRTAVVLMEATSLPALGSLMARQICFLPETGGVQVVRL